MAIYNSIRLDFIGSFQLVELETVILKSIIINYFIAPYYISFHKKREYNCVNMVATDCMWIVPRSKWVKLYLNDFSPTIFY
jgi:hypothetical protein